jgi:hypothetical protein
MHQVLGKTGKTAMETYEMLKSALGEQTLSHTRTSSLLHLIEQKLIK